MTTQGVNSSRGFAFEEVCMAHIRQIKQAINILDVSSTQSAWSVKGDDEKEGGYELNPESWTKKTFGVQFKVALFC